MKPLTNGSSEVTVMAPKNDSSQTKFDIDITKPNHDVTLGTNHTTVNSKAPSLTHGYEKSSLKPEKPAHENTSINLQSDAKPHKEIEASSKKYAGKPSTLAPSKIIRENELVFDPS